MKIARDKDQRFVNLERKVGFFVFISLVGIIGVVLFLGLQKDLFTSKSEIYFKTENATDIFEGMAVKLSGLRIGKVKKMTLDDRAWVNVMLLINTDYLRWIRTDSVAILKKEDFIGSYIIEITLGSSSAIPLTGKYAVIKFDRERGLVGIAEDVKEDIQPAITDIKAILQYINDPNGEIKGTISNLKLLTASLNETVSRLDGMTKTSLPKTHKDVDTLLETSEKTIRDANGTISRLEGQLGGILKKTDKTMEHIEHVSSELSPKLPGIIKKGEAVEDNTIELIDATKQIWPISTKVKPDREKVLKIDGYE